VPSRYTSTGRAVALGGVDAAAFPPGLVAAWTLDDTSGGYVDLVSGRVLSQVGTGTTTTTGVIGDAASFNGSGRLSTPDADALKLRAGFAAETWAWRDPASAAFSNILTKRGAVGAREWTLRYETSATPAGLQFLIVNSSNAESSAFIAGLGVSSTWLHIVGIFTGSALLLYVNGVLHASTPYASDVKVTTTAVTIGQTAEGGATLTGFVDEPRIWQFGAAGDPGAAFWLDRYNAGAGRRP
jgi:hypothetical protein